jgi:hypothetical protein
METYIVTNVNENKIYEKYVKCRINRLQKLYEKRSTKMKYEKRSTKNVIQKCITKNEIRKKKYKKCNTKKYIKKL